MSRRDKSGDRGWLFITGGTHRRLPLFRNPQFCGIVLQNLRFYRRKYGFDVMGYVLLPDHYHLLLAMPEGVGLADFLRDFKSQVGRQIVEVLKSDRQSKLLQRMAVGRVRRWKDARYRALQADNHVRRIFSERFLRQKLEAVSKLSQCPDRGKSERLRG